jgi:hypothetical protein
MVNTDQIPYAKALLGALFIEYVIYGAIYIVEGIKYSQIHEKDNESTTTTTTTTTTVANASGSQPK